jgi:hypothetical protein
MYFKDFDAWNIVKKRIHGTGTQPHIRAGEIRWASIGTNVGSEIDGKGTSFTRPVLVMHVIGHALALVVPFSTKIKDVPGYFPFEYKGTTHRPLCPPDARYFSAPPPDTHWAHLKQASDLRERTHRTLLQSLTVRPPAPVRQSELVVSPLLFTGNRRALQLSPPLPVRVSCLRYTEPNSPRSSR